MNHTVKYLALFSLAFSLAACDDDGLDVRDVEIPQGYALSAGISTIFLNSSVAYDTQADWIDADPDYAMRFRDGDGLDDDSTRVPSREASARSMQDIPAEVAIAMPGVRNRSYGTAEAASAKGEAALTASLPCWCTSAARTAHFSRIMAAYFMTKPSTALNRKAS